MRSASEVAELVRQRSPLSADETERLIRTSFAPARAVRFLCRHYAADRLAVLDIGCGYGQHLVHFGPGSVGLDAIERNVAFVRALVEDQDKAAGQAVRILYGGSLKPDNAAELLALPDVDGALVGGASLDAASFAQIVETART